MIFQLNLTDYQKQKMLNILRTGKSQGIRFSKDQLLQDKGNVLFKLEFDQLKRVYSALKSKHNKGVDLYITKKQIISHLPKYNGGHINMPFILNEHIKYDKVMDKDAINETIKSFLMPIHPLSNIDIENYLNLLNIKNHVLSRDRIKRHHIEFNSCVVLNLHDSSKGGSHWVCLINSKKDKNDMLYYDSFGIEYPPEEILNLGIKNILCNDSQNQDLDSIKCGYYCCKMIKEVLYNGKSYEDAVSMFSENPSNNNEDICDDLFI
tara:strand:+ start:870 stop:1661 length:792 start_codon:yes stop_codon:yes gene_type:complete